MHIPIEHRTLSLLFIRFFKILWRYGLATKKMEANLQRYLHILRKHGISPTFPVTAKTLSRYPDIIRKFLDGGAEFAVHGYEHIDYTKSSAEVFFQHIQEAAKIFDRHKIAFSGFRFPYLKWDNKCLDRIDNRVFFWDSSHTILWDVFKTIPPHRKNWRTYQTVLGQYAYRSSDSCASVPKFLNNKPILEIPVSLPDDDLLFDRLGIKDEKILTEIWIDILKKTYSRGELFTLQLHPERIHLLGSSLESLIQTAKNLYPRVWIAPISAVCKWWREKKSFAVNLNKRGTYGYDVDVRCSPRATLIVRSDPSRNQEFHGYEIKNERKFWIACDKKPILGIPSYASRELIAFLRNEGFVYEISEEREKYSVYLDSVGNFSEEDEMNVLQQIQAGGESLIRFWRWPDGAASALSITGDIDGLTCSDFLKRLSA